MGVQIDLTCPVAALSTGEWQLTEIAKALSKEAWVLIMDEPTAALSATEVATLFRLVSGLKARGIAIVYITSSNASRTRLPFRPTAIASTSAPSAPTSALGSPGRPR